ncbi:DNA gyrase/topoisomerase IV subunit A [Bacteroidales bacterium OttesenSCG-928-C03]|nr:DNA gyrase/topoisomerase IV subunit A [Bacteroidales bacterium OttesenSCG-928-C03]
MDERHDNLPTQPDKPTNNQSNEKPNDQLNDPDFNEESNDLHRVIRVQSMFENWFLDYASYVILDRALPDVLDGLKPVQRRILHSMDELEDGRYNKAANIIGNTMKYHPHGDRSIGDAMVQLGQKLLTIDTQGNWGNILTGDSAAAPRYIEARLSKFAIEVVFNHKTTSWQMSYDGRNKEPIVLPVKFPLLLAQGVEGIAVGLATKILPHNFNELIDASIAILEGKDFEIYPDFPTAGSIDVSKYNDGARGGKIRNRAKITILDKKTLVINEIPFGTNTTKLIRDSITPAIEKGKLKIRKIDDNTASSVEILLHLHPGVSPDQSIDALYAFTDCEMSYSTNACVLHEGRPQFMSVKEILRINTNNTVYLLRLELEIQLKELEDQWHWVSLEKIFFEERIYKELEKDTETWENQVENIERAFDPFRHLFRHEITRQDVLKLCEKPVRKISKFDIKKAEEQIRDIETNIDEVKNHLAHIIDFSINYFKQLKKKYGKDKERKTEIKNFENIVATTVAVANQKLYVDKKEGFVGTGLKRGDENVEYVCDCSDIDEVIVFNNNGTFKVSRVSEKQFFGKDIELVEVFKRGDNRTIYNMVYSDGHNGVAMVKRFAIGGVTRDKEYDLTKGKTGSKVLYLTSNPNGEAEKVKVILKQKQKLKKKDFEFDFSKLAIKGRSSQGNILSRNPVLRVELSEKGISTLSAINVYFDPTVMRLNTEERGELLGAFKEADKIISVYNGGYYKSTGYDLSIHFEDGLLLIQKLNLNRYITVVYYLKKENKYFVKRFKPENSEKKMEFIPVDKNTILIGVSLDYLPQIEVKYQNKQKETLTEIIATTDYVDLMNMKAKGKRIQLDNITNVKFIDPMPYEEVEELPDPEEDDVTGDDVENGDNDESGDTDESLDVAIAKERMKEITVEKPKEKKKFPGLDDDGEQLSLF